MKSLARGRVARLLVALGPVGGFGGADWGVFDTQKKRPGIFLLIVARLVPGL